MTDEEREKAQLVAAVEVAKAVYRAIEQSGTRGMPSGHLYAATMSAFGSLAAYESCISMLIGVGLVKRDNHVLTAVKR